MGLLEDRAVVITGNWALELMPYGVRANALAPAALTRGHAIAGAYGAPNKPMDSPDLVAPAVLYLLSDLSREISGQLFMMLGRTFGLIRGAALPHVEEREQWKAEEIAEVVDRAYRAELQPLGVRSPAYAWAPDQ